MRRTATRLVLAGSMVLLASCGGARVPGGSSGPGSAPASGSPAASVPLPDPANAFTFAGAPTTVAGDVVLDVAGAHELTPNAISFDGVTGYVASQRTGPVQVTRSFSVSAWVSLAQETDYAAAVSELGDEAAAFYLGIGENTWDFAMKDTDSNEPGHTVRAKADPALVRLDQWVHLVGVHDQETGIDRLFVDGALAAETPFAEAWQPNGVLTIGRAQAHGVPSDFWPGAIASVSIYSAALSAEQVAFLQAVTRPTGWPPLMVQPDLHGNAALNGTWDAPLEGAQAQWARDAFSGGIGPGDPQVSVRLAFDGTTWWQGFLFDGQLFLADGVPEGDGGTVDVQGDQIVLTGADGTAQVTYRWALDGDALTLTVAQQCDVGASGMTCTSDRTAMDADMILVTEHTYTRSGDDATY
jgi:hypothetical protein